MLHRAPRTLLTLSLLSLCALGWAACDSDSPGPTAPPMPRVLAPGATIPLATTVMINRSGPYGLAPGGTRLTTVCRGEVAVIIERVPGSPVTNTCQASQGTSRQTNPVDGVDMVIYELGPGASAEVTLN